MLSSYGRAGRAFNVSKGRVYGMEGSRVRVLVCIIYYIVIKVFSSKKKLNYS